MPSTIVATAKSATANSYVTQAECTTYLDDRLNSDPWTDASSDDKDRALLEATREMQLLEWDGRRTTQAQALDWPREDAVDPDATLSDPAQDHPFFDKDTVPQRVKDAQCELALEFLRAGSTDLASFDDSRTVVRSKTDVLETEWEQQVEPKRGMHKLSRFIALITPLIEDAGMIRRA